jgi:hypothetical protein
MQFRTEDATVLSSTLQTVIQPLFNRHSKFAQTLCTIVTHTSPNTMILHTHGNSILLKTCGPQIEKRPVAPNVAGSIPVSHPKHPLITSATFHSLLRPRFCLSSSFFY